MPDNQNMQNKHPCPTGDGEDPEGGGAGGQRAGLLHIPQVMIILMIKIIIQPQLRHFHHVEK